MTAPPPCSYHPGATRVEFELFLKQCGKSRLQEMLHRVQQRLGSPDERLGDVDCAQLIVHQLNNLLTTERVQEALRRLEETAPPPEPGSDTGT